MGKLLPVMALILALSAPSLAWGAQSARQLIAEGKRLAARHRYDQAIAAYGILVLLSVIGRAEGGVEQSVGLFDWLSWNEHLFWFLIGVVRASDLLYFPLLIGFFLALAHRRLANRRLD